MPTATLTSLMTEVNSLDATQPTTVAAGNTKATDTDMAIDGTGCGATGMSGAPGNASPTWNTHLAGGYITVTSINGANKHLHIWLRCLYPMFEAVGISALVGTASVMGAYKAEGASYGGGWLRFALSLDTTTQVTADLLSTGTTQPNFAAIVRIGCIVNPAAEKGEAFLQNTYFDVIRTTNTGDGLRITGGTGTGASSMSFQDISDADIELTRAAASTAYGTFKNRVGSFILVGELQFGVDAGTCYCEDESQLVQFPNLPVSTTFYKVSGNAGGTGITSISFTSISWKGAGATKRFLFDFSALDSGDAFTMVGNTLLFGAAISFPNVGSVTASTFDDCELITPGTATFTGNAIKNSTAATHLILSSTSHGVASCDFTSGGSGHGIEITTAGTYTFSAITFTSYGAADTTDAALYNNSGGNVVINVTNGGSAPTVRNGTSATTTVNAGVTVSFHVEDGDGNNIQNAQVYIQKSTPTAQTSGAGNNAADGDLVVSTTIDSDIPSSGWVIVFDKSENATLPYRYTSHDGANTFTFPTSATGTTDSLGTGTQLLDSGADFGGANDIEEGDTIRNTTDGSWAVIDQIISTTELLTSPLRGGSDNTWQSGDGYSVHDLATTLISGVDTVDIPLLSTQTDASGDVSFSYNYASDTDISIRVRANEGATKYIPFKTVGTITNSGFAGTAVMTEDTVAT